MYVSIKSYRIRESVSILINEEKRRINTQVEGKHAIKKN